MMELHELISVTETGVPNVYRAEVDITDSEGEREVVDYISSANDPHGLAPQIWAAVQQWFADGKTVAPYTPPTPEENRASMSPLTSRQLRLGLHRAGLLTSVQTAIDSLPEPQKTEAQIEWEYGTTFERLNPTMVAVMNALSLTPEQADALWLDALTI